MSDQIAEWLSSIRDLDALLKTTQQQGVDAVLEATKSMVEQTARMEDQPHLPQQTWRLLTKEQVRHHAVRPRAWVSSCSHNPCETVKRQCTCCMHLPHAQAMHCCCPIPN